MSKPRSPSMLLEHILAKAERSANGCLLWQGPFNREGYGTISFLGKKKLLHRVMYAIAVAEIPKDMTVDHICFVRNCCEPTHLQLLTLNENSRRRRKHLSATCGKGHPLSGANLRIEGPGYRRCVTCYRAWDRKRKAESRSRKHVGLVATVPGETALKPLYAPGPTAGAQESAEPGAATGDRA